MGKTWGAASVAVAGVFCLIQSSAFAFPNFNDVGTRALIEAMLRTEAGAEFAKATLGPSVENFNPRASQEVINTLMHPDNRLVADSFERRLDLFERDVKKAGGLERIAEKELATRASRFFGLSQREGEFITFADGETFKVHTSYAARRAEFLMGGQTVPIRVPAIPGARKFAAPPVGFHPDAFEQLLLWEELSGVREFREGGQFFGLKMAPVDAAKVDFEASTTAPAKLEKLFVRGGQIYWPQHPFNTDTTIPFAKAPATEAWPARFTASRSMVIWNRTTGEAFSLKAPTNYPHRTDVQPTKLHLNDDIKAGVYRSDYMNRVDARLGEDKDMTMLREVFGAAEKTGGNGFVVRDLTPLQDGHYYVPALSIPFVGPRIAQLNRMAFEEFWQINYAELLGRSKAKLLLRYGLQMETPNCQNMLIQFDRDLKPTGKLVFRDVSDSQPVRPIAQAMGGDDLLASDAAKGFVIDDDLNPMTDNSFWKMNEDPVFGIDQPTLGDWKAAHDAAYIGEALRLLGIAEADAARMGIKTVAQLEKYLFSTEGRAAIARFHGIAPVGH